MQRHVPVTVLAAAGLLLGGLVPLAAAAPAAPAATAAASFVRTLGHEALADVGPGGIAVDAQRSVYVANTGNDTVAKFLAGSTTPVWTVGRRGASLAAGSFNDPRDVAVLGNRVYVAEPGRVQVLDATTGAYLRNLKYSWRVPIGVSVGVGSDGTPRILVSDGNSGAVELFDQNEVHTLTIPPVATGAGTRDADTDAQGNVYVADYRNNRINKHSPTGQLLRQWGGTGEVCKTIPKPYGVEVDDLGRVYVAASNNNLIRVFDGNGNCIRTIGSNGKGPMQLSQLRRVAVDSGASPLVYAADLWGLKILIYNDNGTFATPLAKIGTGSYPPAGGLNEVPSVAVNAHGIYAVDMNDHRITQWTPDGTTVRTWGIKGRVAGQAQFNWPQGIGLDPTTGHVWVGDTHSNNIKRFAPDGGTNALQQVTGPAGNAFNFPTNIAVDPNGNLYVADQGGGRVRSFTSAGTLRWTATGIGSATGIAWDHTRSRVLATGAGNTPVWSLNPTTGAKTGAGIAGGPSGLVSPRGIAVDAAGNIWVADTLKNRVLRFGTNGGAAQVSFGSFGSGQLQFNHPMGLAVGPDGLLYVADSWNSRVQVFSVT